MIDIRTVSRTARPNEFQGNISLFSARTRPVRGLPLSPVGVPAHTREMNPALDLLSRLKSRESDHRIRAVEALRFQPALGGNRRHTGGTLVCLPRRAVARPMRPHRNPCHRRANHRWFVAPCGSGPASHRFRSLPCYMGPQQNAFDGKIPVARRAWTVAAVSAQPPPEDGGMRSHLYQPRRSQ